MCVSLDQILQPDNISQAISFLKTKPNACSDDGVYLHELEQYWQLNEGIIKRQLLDGTYLPQMIHEKVLLQPNGKRRIITLFSSVDRLILRAIMQKLQPALEMQFSPYSFAYQKGKGVQKAVRCAADWIADGYGTVVEVDIQGFFDHISHERLEQKLRSVLTDSMLFHLIFLYVQCKVESDFQLTDKTVGILQGSPLSPVLSNLYLDELDHWMENQHLHFCRFSDNINIYVSNYKEGLTIIAELRRQLNRLHLQMHPEKSGIYPALKRRFLGYSFEKRPSGILVLRKNFKPKQIYSDWHKSALEKVHHEYHIIHDGTLTRKDFTLLFENEEKKRYLPVEVTDTLNVYSNIAFGSSFFEFANFKKITVNIFDRYGRYQGCFSPARQRNKLPLCFKQLSCYETASIRLDYARKLEIAFIHNLRCNLKYYVKQKPSDLLRETVGDMTKSIRQLNETSSLDKLILIEARCRQLYYHCFSEIIGEPAFHFTTRTKRPPKDPINALISFGNSWLYQKLAQMIHKSSLDIRISFVHSAFKRTENLNLDLADIFKPIIIDRVIFTLINKRMIHEKEHFTHIANGGVYLNTEGKRLFLSELETKLTQSITWKAKKFTYEKIMRETIHDLEQSISGKGAFRPFKYSI